MQKESDNNKPVEKKQYIPPKDHPWRKNMMLKKKVELIEALPQTPEFSIYNDSKK